MVPQAIAKAFTVAGELVGGRCRYLGFVAVGVTDAAFDATLWDGTALISRPVDRISLTAAGLQRAWYGPQGILCENGITIGAITGTLTGIVWYVPQTALEGGVIIDESGSQRVIIDAHNQVDLDNAIARATEGT